MKNDTPLDKNKDNSTASTPSKTPIVFTVISACVFVLTLVKHYTTSCSAYTGCLSKNLSLVLGISICLPLSIIALAYRKKGKPKNAKVILFTNIGIIITLFVSMFFQ